MSTTSTTPGSVDAPRRAADEPAWLTQARTMAAGRMWPIAALYTVAALVATLTNSAGAYVGDNRFEFYWAPAGRLLRETALWDPTRGLGRVGEEFWPIGYPVALLRSLGLSPQLAEHVWHAVVLVVAGLGVVALVRVFRPRLGVAHVIAGLAYMFNPFSATFLLPTVLFWNYAIAPWLLVMFLRGTTSRTPWRWAAGFALLVFTAGNADLPGTFFALVWLLPAAWWLVRVDRSATIGDVLSWVGRAALLTLLTTAAAMAKTLLGADPLAQRLQFTELPERVNSTSSWAESWRGLGFWLSYFSDPSGTPRLPGGVSYYESVLGVLLTFVAPCVALYALWRSRWRPRLLLLTVAVVSLVLMVGSYPPDDPSPVGRFLLDLYDAIPGTASLRNTYKAGSGLMMAVTILLGVSAAAAVGAVAARNRSWRHIPIAAAVTLVFLTSLPFWNGGLYPERNRMDDLPTYWDEALDHIEQQPGAGRVLVLPGSTKTAYRWGEPGDDIFDAALRRHPNVIANAFPLSGPEAANLIDALEFRLAEGTLEPGMLGPIVDALGVEWVLVRNDLDWERSQTPRPAALETVRSDPVLESVAAFGDTGENVVDDDDATVDAERERALPPVELFHVRPGEPDAPAPDVDVLASPDTPPLVVAGDGEAWPQLAAEGLLDGRAVEYTGDLSPGQIRERLEAGAPVVVTDTNRRRLTRIRGAVPTRSHTLSDGQDLDQPAQELFDAAGSQSVTVFPDATRIEASASGTRLIGFQPWLRPANAFDGDEATAWLTAGLEDAEGAYVRVVFPQPVEVDRIGLLPLRPSEDGRQVTAASVHFSDGSSETARLDVRGPTALAFAPRETSYVEVRIDEVDRSGTAAVGFREIEIPGIDLTETIAVPDDLFQAAEDDAALAAELADAPVTYLFERVRGNGPQDEERSMRRRFVTLGAGRIYDLLGQVTVDENTSDESLDALIRELTGSDTGAFGGSRAQGALANRGALAIDGSETTAWGAIAEEGQALTVQFPERAVREVAVTSAAGPQSSVVNSVVVSVGGRSSRVELDAVGDCGAGTCLRRGVAVLPATTVDEVIVSLDGVEGRRVGDVELPARIAEVSITDAAGAELDLTQGEVASECVDEVITIDDRPLPVSLVEPTLTGLLQGEPTAVQSCEARSLDGGQHTLTTEDTLVGRIRLGTPGPASPGGTVAPPEPEVEVLERSTDRLVLRVSSDSSMLVSTGQSHDEGWRASVDGEDLGVARPVDTRATWSVPAGQHRVTLHYEPERTYRLALAVTGVGLLLCLSILVWPRRGEVAP